MQIAIGLCFLTLIYFVVFRLILHFDFKTPDALMTVKTINCLPRPNTRSRKKGKKGIAGGADALKAQVFLDCLGGPDNIQEVTNCATRLRVTVNDR